MKKVLLRLLGIAAVCAFVWNIGCEYGELTEADIVNDSESVQGEGRFSTANNLSNSLLKQIDLASSLQGSNSIQYPYCIYTIRVAQNTQTESNVQSWATKAMNTWIAPLVGQPGWKVTQAQAYRVQRTSTGCPPSHNGLKVYSIEISDMEGANNQMPGFVMHMGGWGVAYLALLHEMGHGIGLGDGYSYDDGSHTPIGQPTSTMKDAWNHNGVLQKDDIDGIRFLWARIRGASEPCPTGYKIGGCTGSRCSGAVYCVPGTNPPQDNCPNDPNKTQPGLCGCGVPEGTCGTCTDSNANCPSWAANGECQKNPGYMLVNCKKSCNQCSTTTDQCPSDPNKTQPGQCGCGTPDTDSDKDGTANCKDSCPSDPKKIAPGQCGCGRAEGTCGTCTDSNVNCPGWAARGECQKNPGYMLVNCKKSCRQC